MHSDSIRIVRIENSRGDADSLWITLSVSHASYLDGFPTSPSWDSLQPRSCRRCCCLLYSGGILFSWNTDGSLPTEGAPSPRVAYLLSHQHQLFPSYLLSSFHLSISGSLSHTQFLLLSSSLVKIRFHMWAILNRQRLTLATSPTGNA